MKKEEIELLALKSYTKGKLDLKKVNKFTITMKRKEIRMYIDFLKRIEAQDTVIIEVSDMESFSKELFGKIRKLYPEKKIIARENKELMAGIRITNNDLIYDFNFENVLYELTSTI